MRIERKFLAPLSAVLLTIGLSTHASAAELAPLPLKPQMGLQLASAVAQTAERFAAEHHWPCAIAVVDDGGWPVETRRMDGAPVVAGIDLAQGKARTAALFRKPTADLENALNKGRNAAATAGFLMMQGGQPLRVQGQVVGAIGISADTPEHDDLIAKAAVRALGEPQAAP